MCRPNSTILGGSILEYQISPYVPFIAKLVKLHEIYPKIENMYRVIAHMLPVTTHCSFLASIVEKPKAIQVHFNLDMEDLEGTKEI